MFTYQRNRDTHIDREAAAQGTTQHKLQDQRPSTAVQLQQQQAIQVATLVQRAALEEEELLQGKFTAQATVQREERPNNTGLPDNLKSGIETLSGYSMDDVKVHYNSDRPAQLNAHAYAQGTDIHMAPGQEQHLPHEAWHVVQQKQGRVKPTMQMQESVQVNDDVGLEHEADVMGARAVLQGAEMENGKRQGLPSNRVTPDRAAQLKQHAMMNVYSVSKIMQRAEKWWPTNAEHTVVTGGELAAAPTEGAFVKREKAGENDELFSTEPDAWTRAKGASLEMRPDNTELFPGTTEKIAAADGDRTYYYNGKNNKATVSIIITHSKDKQSYVYSEANEKLLVVHNHSATANFSNAKKDLSNGGHPRYGNTSETAVHYLSLTRQG